MKIAVDYLTFHELAPTLDFEKYVLHTWKRQERTTHVAFLNKRTTRSIKIVPRGGPPFLG